MRRHMLWLGVALIAGFLAVPAFTGSASALSIGNGAWQWQNPLPQGNGYTDGYFLDASHGWLVSHSDIYHTADGGVTLTLQARHNVAFTAITFVGSKHGWAVGDPAYANGTAILYRTINGGRNWTRVRLRWRGGISDVSFATVKVGWATQRHAVLKTTDGGLHWTRQQFAMPIRPAGVQALSTRRAWVAAGARLLRTVDGGATWTRVRTGTATPLLAVWFASRESGWAAGGSYTSTTGGIVHTTDGGLHWKVQLAAGRTSALSFADSHNGWAAVENPTSFRDGVIYRTTDGGADWVLQAAAPDATWVQAITAQSAVAGTAVSFPPFSNSFFNGGLGRTTDGGASWQASTSAAGDYFGTLNGLQFVDAASGWAVGSGGGILATTDGGAGWTAQASNTTDDLKGVNFADAADGWAVGDQGTIVHTSDGGATWAAQASGTSYDLTGVAFTDAQNGWATGQAFSPDGYSSGVILHTTNGGQDWATQYASTFDPNTDFVGIAFSAVAFADAQHGWAVGETLGTDSTYTATVVMHTSDGGATWTKQLDYNPPFQSNTDEATLASVACTDAEHAVAVGSDENGAEVWRTTNGGQTWSRVKVPASASGYNDVVFADANHGWAVGGPYGSGSSIIRTTNGGATWTRQLVASDLDPVPLNVLSFVSPTRGWAAGAYGDILLTTTGGNAP
jgi:photosystem II stability/assembly factor-like uncharacterized protein